VQVRSVDARSETQFDTHSYVDVEPETKLKSCEFVHAVEVHVKPVLSTRPDGQSVTHCCVFERTGSNRVPQDVNEGSAQV
jgi:hypothetical protein